MKMQIIPIGDKATLGDGRHYPGARVLIVCALCGWQKSYNPLRVIDRLRELKTGGPGTPLEQVARRVAWNCPGCGRVKWRAHFAWPASFDSREAKRMVQINRG
jgi:RNase P subunit RPR2